MNPESKPPKVPPRRFGRLSSLLIGTAIYVPLGVLLSMTITKWLPGDPQLRVMASPSFKHPNSGSLSAVGTVWIQNDGGRDATNVVCTISNCAPEQVWAIPPPPQSTTEKWPDGLTVTFPVLKPRESGNVMVVLAEGSSYSEGDVAVRGDGVVGRPWGQEPDRFATPYVLVPLFILACLLLWWAWARAARMRESAGGGAATTG